MVSTSGPGGPPGEAALAELTAPWTSSPPGVAVGEGLRELHAGREVVLVSKDINMRIKARALGLPAEDYFNDKTLEDGDLLYTGVLQLPPDFWDRHGKDMESWKKDGHTYYRVRGPLVPKLHVNEFVYDESNDRPLYALVKEAAGKQAVEVSPETIAVVPRGTTTSRGAKRASTASASRGVASDRWNSRRIAWCSGAVYGSDRRTAASRKAPSAAACRTPTTCWCTRRWSCPRS